MLAKRDYVVLPSAQRTALQSVDIEVEDGQHLAVILDVTDLHSVTPGLTVSLYGVTSNGVEYLLLAGAAVTTVSNNVYRIGPGLPATANVSANVPVPKKVRIKVAVADADACTYSISAAAS